MKSAAKKAAVKKTATRRRSSHPAANAPSVDLGTAREIAASHLPGAVVKGKFGGASFFIANNVFAFTRPRALVLKLPAETIVHLVATREGSYFTMGQRVMRECALIPLTSRDDYTEELQLLRAAMAFVQSRSQL